MSFTLPHILTGISIALLVVYGLDVAVTEYSGEGFLPIDHKARGIGLGMPSIILPFVAYVLARNNPSSSLGVMFLISGALIIMGGVVVVSGQQPQEDSMRNVLSEAGMLIGIGAIIIALGGLKIYRSRAATNNV